MARTADAHSFFEETSMLPLLTSTLADVYSHTYKMKDNQNNLHTDWLSRFS